MSRIGAQTPAVDFVASKLMDGFQTFVTSDPPLKVSVFLTQLSPSHGMQMTQNTATRWPCDKLDIYLINEEKILFSHL